MAKFEDLTGQRFGFWTVVGRAENTSYGAARWLCKCECGNTRVVKAQGLKNGTSKSCGCHKNDYNRIHGGKGTRLYEIWRQMIYRCEKTKHQAYSKYGGRGITVCSEWHDFTNFRNWSISNGYDDTKSIDRIDNDSGYCPENCRWTNAKTQMNNRSNTPHYQFNGQNLTISEWAEKTGISRSTIYGRLKRGLTFEEAIKH